jgi:hypothetical protein
VKPTGIPAADLIVAEGICDVEDVFDPWPPMIGEDLVVHLTNLEPLTTYDVSLESNPDIGFYVISGCDPETAQPGAGQCQSVHEITPDGEEGTLSAPDGGELWIVIDTRAAVGQLSAGPYPLPVAPAPAPPAP